ncbi:GH3 auxin-responsive promoter family protein [Chloroflexota bacterium]
MLSEDRYFYTLHDEELWQRYCGFLDLSPDEFVDVQRELLLDQIERVAGSKLWHKIVGDRKPDSVDEFRRIVPLTTYEDYEPYLTEHQEDALAMKPVTWCHSAGRSGQFKWYPLSSDFTDNIAKNMLACLILATTNERGQINFRPGARILLPLAPPPYSSALTMQFFGEHFTYHDVILSAVKNKDIEFSEKAQLGFQKALVEGVDIVGSLPSILVRMGEEFDKPRTTKFEWYMLHPRVLSTVLRGKLRSKREHRNMLPKDMWPTKTIMVGGMDAHIYRDEISKYWGHIPYEFYISSESFHIAMQSWNRKWMTFVPDMVFLEFIPHKEVLKWESNQDYQPSTVLLNQVEAGELYEVVVSHFYGMPLLRYPLRDLIKIVALKDDETGINLPQMSFQRRVDEAINIGGLAQLDEKTIWQAMTNTGMKFTEWTAYKEFEHDKAYIKVLIESNNHNEVDEVEKAIDVQLTSIDTDYKDIHYYLEYNPIKVRFLSSGTFERYIEERKKEGSNPTHYKPAHISPTESTIQSILRLSDSVVKA